MVSFFEAAKKRKITRSEIDPVLTASLVYGSLIHIRRNQKIQKAMMGTSIAEEAYATKVTEQFTSILLNGIVGGEK